MALRDALNAVDEEDPWLLNRLPPFQLLVDALPAGLVKNGRALQAVEVVAAEEVFDLFLSDLLFLLLAAEHQLEDVREVPLQPVLLTDFDVDLVDVEDAQAVKCLVDALGPRGSSAAVDEDDAATLLVV